MKKYWFIFFYIIIVSCASLKKKSIYNGGVFVADTIIKNKDQNFDSVFPILAFRIDDKNKDTLLIKYRFGREKHMDLNAVYNKDCACYQSTREVLFPPFGQESEYISIYILSNEKIKISLNGGNEYFFTLTYIDKVNLKTHRNIYYAEDGFKLFKK